MTRRAWASGILAGVFLLAGCGSAGTDDQAAVSGRSTASGGTSDSMAPGMSMAPGESMSDMAGPGGAASAPGKPSAQSRMVCGPEIRRNIGHLLALKPAPQGRATWRDHVYTCTYQLPAGPLVLEVTESANVPAAHRYFASLRHQLAPTKPLKGLTGLGLPAYETRNGTAVFLKDNKVLRVDATKLEVNLRAKAGSQTDIAYEVATDVMGCWSEN